MFYREIPDYENMDIENDNLPNSNQLPIEDQIISEEMDQQQIPMGQSCPYINQDLCANNSTRGIYGDGQFDWNSYPHDEYYSAECPYSCCPYGGYYVHRNWRGYR